jgi:SAM-dependent methyltransferase
LDLLRRLSGASFSRTDQTDLSSKTRAEQISAEKSLSWRSSIQADRYAEAVDTGPGSRFFSAVIQKIFLDYCSPNSYVLDVGCGTGRLAFVLADAGCSVVGCDVSQAMLNKLNEKKGDRGIVTRCADGKRLPFQDNEFDVVTSMDYLLHFPNWTEYLAEMIRVCRDGGLILYNFASKDHAKLSTQFRSQPFRYQYTSDQNDLTRAFCAECELKELNSVCEGLRVKLVKVHPYGLLFDSWLIGSAVDSEALKRFEDQLEQSLKQEQVLRFLCFVEESLVRHLPAALTYYHVVVLRKGM